MKNKFIMLLGVFITFITNAETLSFKNFDQEYTFEKNENGYFNVDSQQQVTIAHRLIIKTSKKYNKIDLTKADSSITEVKELYQGKDFTYFLAVINNEVTLKEAMEKLVKNTEILLIQVDVLQKTEKSHDDDSHKNIQLKKPVNKLQQEINRQKQLATSLPRYLKFIEIEKLWEKSKGQGINIAVIDDGFDLKHKEFEKTKLAFSYDATEQVLTVNPKQSIDTHGTKIAGVLFAQHDQLGIEGIAPDANFIAIRQPDTWTSNTLLSFQMANLAKADIINCSWNSPQLMEPVADVVNDLAQNGRNGKGTLVVFAAGNKGIELKPNSTEASIDSAVVVGASNFVAKRVLKSSNTGKSVDLMFYGRPVQSTLPNNKYGDFSGTSLAATIVSGISALLLSQNPEMTIVQLQAELKKMTTTKKRATSLNIKPNQNKGNK